MGDKVEDLTIQQGKDEKGNASQSKDEALDQIDPRSGTATADLSPSSHSGLTFKRSSTTPLASSATSATTSPRLSREGSPTRQAPKIPPTPQLASRSVARSRQNSQDRSPAHGLPSVGQSIPTVPSAAAIQRALSLGTAPVLTPTLPSPAATAASQENQVAAGTDSPRSNTKSNKTSPAGSNTPVAPRAPRLSSPPPAPSSGYNKVPSISVVKKAEPNHSGLSTTAPHAERSSTRSVPVSDSDGATDDESDSYHGMRTPSRAASGAGPTLETVIESTPPTESLGMAEVAKKSQASSSITRPERIIEDPSEDAAASESTASIADGSNVGSDRKTTSSKESGDDVSRDASRKIPSTMKPPPLMHSKKSFTQIPIKGKAGPSEGSTKTMTVETETVSSIPQVAVGGGTGERITSRRVEPGGSVKLKPSNETIRPKKEKKRITRKAPSIHSGTASSKADIFEAKVASAVGDADSSDSEETFVYESNPPEPLSARPHRFHSRTPSTASTLSQLDPHGVKGRSEGHHSLVGKKSMKFANTYNTMNYTHDGDGTVRGPSQSGRGTSTPHHHHANHHIGRYGRGGHTSLFDNDSPFANPVKTGRSATSHLQSLSPRHGNSRSSHALKLSGDGRKSEEILNYDLEGEGADDERAPLVGSMRSVRNRRRPLPGSVRQTYGGGNQRSVPLCSRGTVFLSLGSVLAILIAAIVAMLILCTKPLLSVQVQDIRNVLASESEIMLDLYVHGINPNMVAIQVSELDVNLFAKSRHVGTSSAPHEPEKYDHHQPVQPPHFPKASTADAIQDDARSRQGNQPASAAQSFRPSSSSANLPKLSSLSTPLRTPQDLIDQLPPSLTSGGIDEGTDPIPNDPAQDAQTMLLGRILTFDSPLIFEPSPFYHHGQHSLGSMRLSKPGNRTEEGGSARWEHVLLYDFELIVRGVVKYSLPIGNRLRSASIGARISVKPSRGDDDNEDDDQDAVPSMM